MTRKTRTTGGGPASQARGEAATPTSAEAAGPPVPQSNPKTRRAGGKLQAVLEMFAVFPAKD
jgi:hypothetical protein